MTITQSASGHVQPSSGEHGPRCHAQTCSVRFTAGNASRTATKPALLADEVFPRLRAAVPGLDDITDTSGRRYIGGVALTDEGLQLWELHNIGPQLKGGSKGVTATKMEVNKTHGAPAGSAAEVQF